MKFLIVCYVLWGSQAGEEEEEDSGAFLKFSKAMTFHRKKYPHKA